ncbi:hypothetical protein [Streptomyces chartreusis]
MSDETVKPLAAVEAMESAAFRLGQLARRILAEHVDAGLSVREAGIYGYEDVSASARLGLRARDLEAARAVAISLGIELAVKTNDTQWSVFEHGHGTGEVDGFEVNISGMHHFSDEEAAAWRAEQPAAEGGDPS